MFVGDASLPSPLCRIQYRLLRKQPIAIAPARAVLTALVIRMRRALVAALITHMSSGGTVLAERTLLVHGRRK